MTRKAVLHTVWEYLVLTLACFIFAMAWECFMIPNGMSAGGLMGLSTIIQYATGGLVPAQYTYFGINALLIIVAVMAMGIGFGFMPLLKEQYKKMEQLLHIPFLDLAIDLHLLLQCIHLYCDFL